MTHAHKQLSTRVSSRQTLNSSSPSSLAGSSLSFLTSRSDENLLASNLWKILTANLGLNIEWSAF